MAGQVAVPGTLPDEEQVPEEGALGGLLDPIKQKGVLRGGLELAGMMVPGAITGSMAAERAKSDNAFTTEELFATLKDFAHEASFVTPGIGEVQGFRMGRELLSAPTDWLTKGMGALGVVGLPLSATGGAAHAMGVLGLPMPARAAALTPGARSPKTADVVPVISRVTNPDDLSRLAGVTDSPIMAGGVIPTTTDTSQQLMVALNGVNNSFKEADRVTRLRTAILGGRVKTAEQVEGFLIGLGDALSKRLPDYVRSVNEPGMTPGIVRVSATGNELSKFDTIARRGFLSVDDGFADVGGLWARMKKGDVLTLDELNDLTAGVLEHAELTAAIAHPQMAMLGDARFAVVGVHLGGRNRGVSLAPVLFDGVAAGMLTEPQLVTRLGSIARHSPEATATHMSEIMVKFWDDQVIPHMEELQTSGVLGPNRLQADPPTDGTAAVDWYRLAHSDADGAAQFHGLNTDRVVGVASLTSAAQRWETNIDKSVAVLLYLRENPTANAERLHAHMNDVGLKLALPEAVNIMALHAVPDDLIQGHFMAMLSDGKALKQPNFVLAIINSSVDDSIKQASLTWAMSKGMIAATEADGLFKELGMTVPRVVDRHAINMAFGGSFTPAGSFADDVYPLVGRALEAVSVAIGPQQVGGVTRFLSPSEVQAIMWVRWREWRGVTQKYKSVVPETGKEIRLPKLFIDGIGSNQVFDSRFMKWASEPLPQNVVYSGIARESRGVFLTTEQLRGRHKPGARQSAQGRVTPGGLTSAGKAPEHTVALSMTEDGMFVVAPPGAIETNRNMYHSVGWTDAGQIMRPKVGAAVADIDVQLDLLNRAMRTKTDGTQGLTGYRIETPGHRALLFEDGRHIGISAAKLAPDGSDRAYPGHLVTVDLLTERGVNFTHQIEPAHDGSASVWRHKGREYWSRAEVVEAGLNPDTLIPELSTEPGRVRMVLTFPDAQSQNRAMVILSEQRPHRAMGQDISVQGAMAYIDGHGRALDLRVPRGIKEQARMGTTMESPVAGRRTVFDPVRAEEIARAFEAAPVKPTSRQRRATHRSYRRLVKEIEAQYAFVRDDLGIEIIVQATDPYNSPAELMRDIRDNKTLRVLATETTGPHPLMSNREHDMFRAVHDFFGHAGLGNTFDRHGEVVAYLKHSQMFSELARGAMFTETMAASATQIQRNGFAPQKAVLMPQRFWSNDTLFNDPSLMKGSDVGRRLDDIYQEEILDLVAYTNGDNEAPYGSIAVNEHHYVDPSGRRLVQLSPDADPGASHSGQAYVMEHDGMWSYMKDSESLRHSSRSSLAPEHLHEFTTSNGATFWDNTARVLNPETLGSTRNSKHLFDVKVDGRVPTHIAMYIPDEGTALPEVMYNQRTIPGRPPARVVVLTRTATADFKRGGNNISIEYPANPTGGMHSHLVDDTQQALRRTGFLGNLDPKPRGS